MERPLVTAVTHSTAEARVTLTGLPDRPGIAAAVLGALAAANVNVDMIIQNEPQTEGHKADMSFTVPRDDLPVAREALEPLAQELGFGEVQTDELMGKVSVVGAGMKSHPGVAHRTFKALGDAGVNIEMISTSPIKISCVVREQDVETAVRELHQAFELGAEAVRPEDVAGDPGRWSDEGRCSRRHGAVGSTMLGVMRERGFPADEVVPFASERSAGRKIDHGNVDLEVRALSDGSIKDFDLALFSAGSTISEDWGRALRGGCGGGGQLVLLADEGRRAAGGRGGEPRGARRPPRDRGQPQLLDDADGGSAQADSRRGGIERLVISTYQSVSGTGQRAVEELRPGARRARGRRAAAALGLPPPDRLQRASPGGDVQGGRRLHDRGAQDDGRDAQDPRRAGHRDLGHLRARPGLHGPLGVDQRPDARPAVTGGVPRPAAPRLRRHRG